MGQLARKLPVSRPAVSQHLKVLKGAGLVTERREGTRRVYSVELRGIAGRPEDAYATIPAAAGYACPRPPLGDSRALRLAYS